MGYGRFDYDEGTTRLANHYNDEFGSWINFYRATDVLALFDRKGKDIQIWRDLVNYITDDDSPDNGHTADPEDPTLLPPKHVESIRILRRRWKFFLQKILSQTNQNNLADAIHSVLTDARNVAYILFDVKQGSSQDVIVGYTTDPDGKTPIATITLQVVAAMPDHPSTGKNDPPPLDPQ